MRKIFATYKTSYEDGSKWIGYEENGQIRYVLVEGTVSPQNYNRIIEKQKPIDNYPDIKNAHDLLKELYDQVIDNDMGFIELDEESIKEYEEQYKKPWEQLRKELKKDVEKFNLEDIVKEEDNSYIAGYGNLISVMKRSVKFYSVGEFFQKQ